MYKSYEREKANHSLHYKSGVKYDIIDCVYIDCNDDSI